MTPARAATVLTHFGFAWLAIAQINTAAVAKWSAELQQDAFTPVPPTLRSLR